MCSQRYTPEFKDEAVRQVIDRGYTVAEVADRLGVSTHSLYKWGNTLGHPENQANILARNEAFSYSAD